MIIIAGLRNQVEFTYLELENIFKSTKHKFLWNKNTSIVNFFPEFTKKRKAINNKRDVYYKFKIQK